MRKRPGAKLRRRTESSLRARRKSRLRSSREGLCCELLEPKLLLTTVGGAIAADTVWTIEESPYEVESDITVEQGATLEIEAGVTVLFDDDTGISVRGRVVAEGTAFDRIRFDVAEGQTRWDGLAFQGTLTDSRITFADMNRGDGQGEAINVNHSRLMLDSITWNGTTGTILELEHPSVIVRNSVFPVSEGGEIIHGEYIEGEEYLIIDGNVFENSQNGGDVIDVLGADRPGPVMQILNNVFKGGGDDGLDLDGTDAHVEGNLFMNFNKNTGRSTTSNAIATGLPQTGADNRTQVTIVRNIFVDNDHAILLKEDAFATVENNVFVGSIEAAIQFNEVGGTAVNGPGMGAALDGNIFHNNASLFKNLVDDDEFKSVLSISNSLLPNDPVDFDGVDVLPHSLGTGNIAGDPKFVDEANGNFRLQNDSPAVGAGPYGLDMGAYVLGGPTVTRPETVPADEVSFTVGGPGITHYRFRVDSEPYGPITAVTKPIVLSQTPAGQHQVHVIGMNSAGEWYTGETYAFQENVTRVIAPTAARNGETLPMIVRVTGWQGETNSLFTGPLDFVGPDSADAAPFDETVKVKKGVGSAAPVIRSDETSIEFSFSGSGIASDISSDAHAVDLTPRSEQTHSGVLSGDTVWDATMDHHLTGDITIPQGSSLTMGAGTRVLADSMVNIRVLGELRIQGTIDDPVVLTAADATQPWGGLEIVDTEATIDYAFFTNGGSDTSKAFGHSDSQPLIFVDGSTLDCDNCYVINNTGKAFGSRGDAIVNIHQSVISDVDTGAQFNSSIVTVTETWLKNIPNDDDTFVDDDNDGFYFSGVHSSGAPSRFQDSFIIETKDDGLDHNGANLEVVRAWIQGADHEGIASSNRNEVHVLDSVFIGNNQGVEAGYRDPDLFVTNSVVFNNRNVADAGSPITAGIRFGDGYDGSNGAYTGHIEARNVVVHDNGDNVRNWDGDIGAPQIGAIDITHSLTNDPDYDDAIGNRDGVPVFGPNMHLLRGSAGRNLGTDGTDVGRLTPAVRLDFLIESPDGKVRINEVNATGGGDGGFNFIELLNSGGAAVDLSGYRLSYELQQMSSFEFPAETILGGGEVLTVVAGTETIDGLMVAGFDIDARGGTVHLATPNGAAVDSIDYNQQLAEHSLTRTLGGQWVLGTPSPDAENRPTAMGKLADLQINEWLATADANRMDFVELFNSSGFPIDLGGLFVTNDVGNANVGGLLPQRTFIEGDGLFVLNSLPAPDQVAPTLPVNLDGSGGEITILEGENTVDHITYGAQTDDVSQGRVPNGGDRIGFFDPPNPWQDNPDNVVSNTVSFRDGDLPDPTYTGTQDVWLRGTEPNTTFGDDERTDADGQSGDSSEWTLLRWDVSAIDPTTEISAATVTLTIDNSSDTAYQVYAMTTDWDESTATWNSPGNGGNWESPGTGPTDRGVLVAVIDTGDSTGTFDFPLNPSGVELVQGWIANPSANLGLIIYNADATDGIEIRTSEYSNIRQRPTLSIEKLPTTSERPTVVAATVDLTTLPQSLTFEFSESVFVDVGDLRLQNTTTGDFFFDFEFEYDDATNSATWRTGDETGLLPVGDYVASVLTEEVVDADGNRLADNAMTFSRLYGDVDGSQSIDARDIDSLCRTVGQSNNGLSDLNSDGVVKIDDLDLLVRTVLSSEYGDADLDGVVDTDDYDTWAANRFSGGTTWATGDFTCDGSTDGSDFNVWNEHKFGAVRAVASSSLRPPRAALTARVSAEPIPASWTHRDSQVGQPFEATLPTGDPTRDAVFEALGGLPHEIAPASIARRRASFRRAAIGENQHDPIDFRREHAFDPSNSANTGGWFERFIHRTLPPQ